LKDRLVTLALAAAALAMFYLFMAPRPAPAPQDFVMPLSTAAGPEGYLGLWRWLSTQHIPVAALHDPYTRLAAAYPAAGNLLIATLPQQVPARRRELDDLDLWVNRGNTLLVIAAIDDTPHWAMRPDAGFFRVLERMTGMDFHNVTYESSKSAASGRPAAALSRIFRPLPVAVNPVGPHALLTGVHRIEGVSDFPTSRWRPDATRGRVILGLAAFGNEPCIWLERRGQGQVIIVGLASPWSNAMLAEGDNARFLSNVIAWSRGGDGAVIFDDDHQGAVAYYDAHAFFADPRLHRTIVWLIALWLLFVLGTQPMRSDPTPAAPADVTAFIAVTGSFLATQLPRQAVAARLIENFARLEPVVATLSEPQRAELKRLCDATRAGKAVDLVRLQNILSHLRGSLH